MMDELPPNEAAIAGDGKPMIERAYRRLAAYHAAPANVNRRAAAKESASGGGGSGVAGAVLGAHAALLCADELPLVDRVYAAWAPLEDDEYAAGGTAACALGGGVVSTCLGACLGCLGMGGAHGACGAVGGAATEAVRGMAAVCGMHGACGAVGGDATEAVRGVAAACGMVPQQGGTAADGAQAQGGVRITYFKVNTD